jgi:hypothetical protein
VTSIFERTAAKSFESKRLREEELAKTEGISVRETSRSSRNATRSELGGGLVRVHAQAASSIWADGDEMSEAVGQIDWGRQRPI